MSVFRLAVLVAMLLAIIGCEREAAYQVSLPESNWSIVAVGDQAVADASIAFDDVDHATLSLSCGDIELGWVWDSDGSAMSFAVPGVGETCSEADLKVLEALADVEAWRVDDREVITLLGSRTLRLERLD